MKRGTIAFSWGPWGGFYLHRHRVCLGWVAVTWMSIELDDLMEAYAESPTRDQTATAFRAYVESQCESPSDVVEALSIFDLPEGLAEQVGKLLEATECPGKKR